MRNNLLSLMLFAILPASAQETLTIQDAVQIALRNNFDIRIAANDVRIDKENVALGNAGILPNAQASVVDNNGIQNTTQVRSDGTRMRLDNASNTNLQYGVNLNWTIFDGFRMFARYDQLKEQRKLGESELRQTIIGKVGDVINTYYQIVRQQQQLHAYDTTMVISKQRVELAQNRFTIGKAAKLEVLNAQVDLNTDETNLLGQKALYANTKTQLNEILARDVNIDFVVSEELNVDETLQLDNLSSLVEKQNPSLQAQLINKRINELNLKQVRALRFPTIGVNTGYNFNETQSSLGFTSESYARGFTYGLSASVNLFDGFNQRRNERVAKIQIENSDILIAQQTESLKSQITTAFQTYLTNVELTKLEARNEDIAKQNLDITLDKFRIGTITTIEVRTAQLNYVNAKVRNSDAKLQAKLAEVALRQLAGDIPLK